MQTLRIVILFCIICSSNSGLTEEEVELTYLLLNHFHGSSCIYAAGDSNDKVWPARNFRDKDNYLWSVLTWMQLQEMVLGTKTGIKRSGKSMIVLKAEEGSFSTLREISDKTSISLFTWIMYSDGPFNNTDFQGIHIPFNCEFIYIYQRDNLYVLVEIYQIERAHGIEISSFGFWIKDGGLTIHEEIFYQRRNNLKGRIFPALIRHVPPYVTFNATQSKTEQYNGYMYQVWKELEHRINFGTELLQEFDETNTEGLGTYDVEFIVAPVIYDSSNLDDADITYPIYESKSYLFGHRPGSELEWDSYLKPFDSQTWWVTLGWMACSSAALAILYQIAWTYGTSEKEADYFIFTLPESLATVFRAMCMQGSDVTPRSNSCRLLFLSIYLTALVVSSAFSAALFSLLTIPTARAPFNDFREVINNKAYKIGILRDSDIHNILQDYTAKFPLSVQNDLLRKVTGKDGHPETLLNGLELVCRNKMFIMMSELPYVLHTLQNMTRDCQEKVMPAGPTLLRTFIGFGLKKGSPYKEIIDFHLLMMRNEGIIQRLLLNNWPPHIPSVQVTWVRVTLADISPILYMFGLGAVLAATLLLLEKVFHSLRGRSNANLKKKLEKGEVILTKIAGGLSAKPGSVSRRGAWR